MVPKELIPFYDETESVCLTGDKMSALITTLIETINEENIRETMKQEYKKLGTANLCKKEDLIRFHGILEDVLLQDNNICDSLDIDND
ncbi:hypothetical protein KUTeg_012181 [Tegillarca granosa]|uniref:Uncharacterized protein n=1 Tax=Tegillarca granosa TaxID=220873 RepID=A0ABQ9F287_TEGGR|nr:hypothetical protein KUTeg_012181 [Tegillarca granosa]